MEGVGDDYETDESELVMCGVYMVRMEQVNVSEQSLCSMATIC